MLNVQTYFVQLELAMVHMSPVSLRTLKGKCAKTEGRAYISLALMQ